VRRSKGFTLAELLFAMGLFMGILLTLAAINAAAVRNQRLIVARTSVGNHATMIRYSVERVLAEATYILTPSSGAASSDLTVLENVDPSDAERPLVADLPRRFTRLCVDGSGRYLYHYTGRFPVPEFGCGDAPKDVARQALAGGETFEVAVTFYRPAGESNLVLAEYGVELPQDALAAERRVAGTTMLSVRNAHY